MLSHTQVVDAVAATNDLELASWVEEPGSYAKEPVAMDELQSHQLFRIMPDGVSHPMSFLIALHPASGRAMVTTGNPGALASLLAAEPALAKTPALAQRVFRLVREESRRQWLLGGPQDLPEVLRSQELPVFAPEVEHDSGGWRFRFAVLDGAGLLQHWVLRIPAQGAASLEQKTVARGLDVSGMKPTGP